MTKHSIAPRKRFSQNFLTDTRTALKIASQLQAGPQDVIVEIGPGTGALTEHLLNSKAERIVAIDLDPRAVEALQHLLSQNAARLAVVQGDVLKSSAEEFFPNVDPSHRLVIGNIPYAITSDILFWLFDQRLNIGRSVIMMQREVARRCVAGPGTKDYGILSVATWYAAAAKIAMTVQPGSFFPRPDVTSCVVVFTMRPQPPTTAEFKPFMAFVRAAFSQRRKVLTNSLASWASLNKVDIKSSPVRVGNDLSALRAEQLSPDQLAMIYLDLAASAVPASGDTLQGDQPHA